MQYPWNHNRRFNAYANYFKHEFGERIQKLSIDAGFTCPNRDGTINTIGCTYCNNDAFNPSYCQPSKSITQQINEGIIFHEKRYRRAHKYLTYLQAYSNTHAPIDHLKKVYDEAIAHPKVVGLVIGTRPDCINDEILSYLQQLSKSHYITIEYGIESCYNKTLQRIHRGHTFEQAVEVIIKTKEYNIPVGAHLILGLPGESEEEMLKEAKIVSTLPIQSIKLHQLQIIKETPMANEYVKNPDAFNLFSLEQYIDFIIRFIEQVNPAIVIERFTSEVPPRFLVAPSWGLIRNDQILNLIEKKLEQNNTWQGKFYTNEKI